VAEALVRRGYAVAVTGSAGEKDLTRRVSRAAPGSLDLGGRTDLSTLIALVRLTSIMVSNDTGPAHLAYALKTPSVTLFGPTTDAERWGPLDRGRNAVLRGDPISEVPVEDVLQNVETLVGERERSA
jgi:ADP-heptose:LPS heptosyltransferase